MPPICDGGSGSHVHKDKGNRVLVDPGNGAHDQVRPHLGGIVHQDVQAGFNARSDDHRLFSRELLQRLIDQ